MIFNYALRQFEAQQDLIGATPLVSLFLQILGVVVISSLSHMCCIALYVKFIKSR